MSARRFSLFYGREVKSRVALHEIPQRLMLLEEPFKSSPTCAY
jgi:hypothetical protein